ncbi:MAG: hypothetical protein DDT39_00028 [Firmicutes bacterium]|nr:hypothetical protein [candidate division NPL-UPA2 bacterium]
MTDATLSASSAVLKVSTRGRKPALLKNGKPVAEAKKEAKAAVSFAKAALRDANAGAKASDVSVSKLIAAFGKASRAVDAAVADVKLQAQDKAAYKANIAAAKSAQKDVQAAQKIATKTADTAHKAVAKAAANLEKAKAAVVSLEASIH